MSEKIQCKTVRYIYCQKRVFGWKLMIDYFWVPKSRDLNDSVYNFFGKTHTMECYVSH